VCFIVLSTETLPLPEMIASQLMLNQVKIEDAPPLLSHSANKGRLVEWKTTMAAKLNIKVNEKQTIVSTMHEKLLKELRKSIEKNIPKDIVKKMHTHTLCSFRRSTAFFD
jgi:hypothetical protein